MVGLIGTFALLAGSLAGASPGERELFADNGFEDGMSAWKSLDMSGTLELELDSKTKKSGKQSLRITRGPADKVDFVKQFAVLSPAEGEVRFSMQYRVEREGEIKIQVFFFDDSGAEVGPFADVVQSRDTKKKWLRAEKELEVPAGATSFGLNVWALAPGTVWIDDVSAVHVGPEGAKPEAGPLALANGGFEVDLAGWEAQPFGSGTARAVRDGKRASAGKAALRLERQSVRLHPRDEWRAVSAGKLSREKSVSLRYACLVGESARASLSLQALSETGALLATARAELLRATQEFESGSLALDLPPGTRKLAVTLAIGGRGSVWFDELELEAH